MYNITLNKEQLKIINIALASYVRSDYGKLKVKMLGKSKRGIEAYNIHQELSNVTEGATNNLTIK